MCQFGGLQTFVTQNKIICDVCDSEEGDIENKIGVFNYDFEKNGSSFVNKPQSREFRNLKIAIERHLQSDYHEKKIKENIERDIEDEKDRIYNEKVGIKLGLIIYKNVKDKASYLQYDQLFPWRLSMVSRLEI